MKTDGRYSRIKSKFWTDEKSRLWDMETKYLALYLLTCPHKNILGFYVLPKLYICADLSWDLDKLETPLKRLIEDEFINYDQETNLVFLCNFLKHNPIENANQAQAAMKQLKELPNSSLLLDFKDAVEQLDKPFLKPLIEHFGQPVIVSGTEPKTVKRIDTIHAPGYSEVPAENSLYPKSEGAQVKTGVKPGIDNEYSKDFEEFWAAYPRKKEKQAAFACWKIRKKEGHLPDTMLAAAKAYTSECRQKATEEQFIKLCKTFLGPKKPFLDYLPERRAVESNAYRFKSDDYTG